MPSERCKVAVVIDPWDYPYNGTVVSTRRFVAALKDQVDFRLLATPMPGVDQDVRVWAFPKLSIPGFNGIIDSMKVPLANPWSRQTSVLESLEGMDLIHMQFPFFLGAEVCRHAKKLGIPLVCSFHVQPENLLQNLKLDSPRLARLLYKLFIWGVYRHADLIVTPSQFAAEQLLQNGLNKPVEVLSNGVPDTFFKLQKSQAKEDKFLVLSVGRLAPEKHHAFIFKALAQSRYKDRLKLRLIGSGPLESELIRLAAGFGLDAQIGAATDEELMRAYASADLFVHAGEVELEGMSVLEAMASGNAVLVSDSPNSAANELVDGESSLFDHRSDHDLSEKIDYWLERPQDRTSAGEQNRRLAAKRNHEASVTQLKSIYARLLPQRMSSG